MIHKVQKRPKRLGGKRVLSKSYYLRYRYGDMPVDKWRSLRVSTKEAAEALANEFRKEWEAEQAGIALPSTARKAAKCSLTDHLELYLGDIRQRGKAGRRDKGVKQTESRLRRLFAQCNWKFPINVTPDSFISWRSKQKNLAPRTLNHYLQEAVTFLNWLEDNQMILGNPLRYV